MTNNIKSVLITSFYLGQRRKVPKIYDNDRLICLKKQIEYLEKIDHNSKYVAFLEWDDMYTSDNLQKKIEIFEKHKDVALVYSDLSFIDKDDNIILKSFFKQRNIPFLQFLTKTLLRLETFFRHHIYIPKKLNLHVD